MRILINVGTLAQGLQIDFPNSMVIRFSALGPIQGHKAQHLLVTWGEFLFSNNFFLKKRDGAGSLVGKSDPTTFLLCTISRGGGV